MRLLSSGVGLAAILWASLVVDVGCGSNGGGGGGAGDGGGGATCEAVCHRLDRAACSDAGPSDCIEGCNALLAGPCKAKLQALLDCAASAATTCSGGKGQPIGCDAEDQALDACEQSLADGGR